MPNIEELRIDIHNDLLTIKDDILDTRMNIDELCKKYEGIIKDLHKSLVFKDKEIKELKIIEENWKGQYCGDH